MNAKERAEQIIQIISYSRKTPTTQDDLVFVANKILEAEAAARREADECTEKCTDLVKNAINSVEQARLDGRREGLEEAAVLVGGYCSFENCQCVELAAEIRKLKEKKP